MHHHLLDPVTCARAAQEGDHGPWAATKQTDRGTTAWSDVGSAKQLFPCELGAGAGPCGVSERWLRSRARKGCIACTG
eukprot:3114709-Alexandrium_andersonii.AAC.1